MKKYRDLNFRNGGFKAVWIDDSEGKRIAGFDCDNFEEAKRFAKILTDILNDKV